MKVRIKRIDKSLPLPKYQTGGAVAFDLYARQDCLIAAKQVYRIPTNIIIEIPKGYMLYVQDRSSLAVKKGLMSISGIIDQDYFGPEDEILFQVYNFSDKGVSVGKGERVGQAVFVRIDKADWDEAENDLKDSIRGGFGSTDL